MKKPHMDIGIIGHIDHGNTAIAKAVANLHAIENQPIVPVNNKPSELNKKVYSIYLTEKQIKIVQLMQAGAFIESTNGSHKCDGMDITKQSLNYLKTHGLIEFNKRIGKYSVEIRLTALGGGLDVKN